MIAILAFPLAASAEPPCSVQHPASCGGTYALVEAPGFQDALRRFVGNGRAIWYEANADRTQQLFNVLSGPSTAPVAIGADLLRFDACHPHVCNLRAALFMTRAGEMRGAALIYPDCGGGLCSGDERLKVTILRDARYPDVAELARHWAEEDVAATNARFPAAHEAIGRVQVEDVDSPAAGPRRRISRPHR